MLTGDFFDCLQKVGAWDAIANFPARTFFYAMRFGCPVEYLFASELDGRRKEVHERAE